MPQLDPTSFPSQLFWLTITFVALYLALSIFIVPKLSDILRGRKSRIDGDLAEAETFSRQAEEAKTSYEAALFDARAKSEALIAETQAKAAAEEQASMESLDRELGKKTVDAETAVQTASKKALENMGPAVTGLVSEIVEKIIRQKPEASTLGAAVVEASKRPL